MTLTADPSKAAKGKQDPSSAAPGEKPDAKPDPGKPDAKLDPKDDLKDLPLAEVEKRLESSPDGLTQAKAEKRLT